MRTVELFARPEPWCPESKWRQIKFWRNLREVFGLTAIAIEHLRARKMDFVAWMQQMRKMTESAVATIKEIKKEGA